MARRTPMAIASGRYNMVLSATGFLYRRVDGQLADACRGVGIRYIRVDKGRPMASLRALARDLAGRTASRDALKAAG